MLVLDTGLVFQFENIALEQPEFIKKAGKRSISGIAVMLLDDNRGQFLNIVGVKKGVIVHDALHDPDVDLSCQLLEHKQEHEAIRQGQLLANIIEPVHLLGNHLPTKLCDHGQSRAQVADDPIDHHLVQAEVFLVLWPQSFQEPSVDAVQVELQVH